MKDKAILILGCFDTKAQVFAHLRTRILAQGEQVIMLDLGTMGSTALFPVDITSNEVAEAAGTTIEQLRTTHDRGQAVEAMGRGAAKIIAELVANGRIKAAIGMGGGGGTYMALTAMQSIPLGVPKVCLTTVAVNDLSRLMGHKDITLMPSVVDVAGMNSIIEPIIDQAAAAICAMANVKSAAKTETKGSIALSMFGNTTACADQCTRLLQEEGYEVLAFHANGTGGRTMEALIREGCFDAVLDLTTTELADHLCHGVCDAGPNRLTAAAAMNIPQVVAPGCLDMVNFWEPDAVPVQFKNRHLYSWAPNVTLMRTNEEENRILGKALARKLQGTNATIILPLKGISQIDTEGNDFHNPKANQALCDSIKENSNEVEVLEVNAHINDKEFAEVLVKTLLKKMES